MKKIIISIAAVAASLALASCTKVELSKEGYTITLIEQESPKTTITEGADYATFAWDNEDLSKFTIATYTDPETLNFATAVNAKLENGKVVITATFATAPAEGSLITGWMAHSTLKYYEKVWPAVPISQSPLEGQYDPKADILIIDPSPLEGQTDVKFFFRRPVGIGKMTLKGIAPGTTVNSVEISSTNHICNRRYEIKTDTGAYGWGGSNGQILTCSLGREVDASGNLDVWYTIDPSINGGDKKLKLTVHTDVGDLSKDLTKTTLHFEAGKVTRFSVGFEGITPERKPITLNWSVLPSTGKKSFVWPFVTTNDLPTSTSKSVHAGSEVVYDIKISDTLYPFTFYSVGGLSSNSDARITFYRTASNTEDYDYVKFPVIDGYTITKVVLDIAKLISVDIEKFVSGEMIPITDPLASVNETANSDSSMASIYTPLTWNLTESNEGLQLGFVSKTPTKSFYLRGINLEYTPVAHNYGSQGAAGANAENIVIAETL